MSDIEIAAGFDIGTTTSCAAIWINDKVEILKILISNVLREYCLYLKCLYRL